MFIRNCRVRKKITKYTHKSCCCGENARVLCVKLQDQSTLMQNCDSIRKHMMLKRFFSIIWKTKWRFFFILKYDNFSIFEIRKISFANIFHYCSQKSDFSWSERYLYKKRPNTYFLSNLCKILDIFANEIFHVSNMKNFSYFETENFCHLVVHMIEKNHLLIE